MSFEDLVRDELRARSDDIGASPDLKAELMTLLRDNATEPRSGKRHPQLILLAAAAALVLLAFVAVSQLGSPRSGDVITPPTTPTPTLDTSAGTLVDVGGRSIHLQCEGGATGSTRTVLLDQHLTDPSAIWGGVRARLGDGVRTCVYEHAGRGQSDPRPGGLPTAQQLADDLSALIASESIGGPVVLVSFGPMSLAAATLVHDAPGQVDGLVFIEPRDPDVTDQHLAALGTPSAGDEQWMRETRAGLRSRDFEPTFDLKASENATRPFFNAASPLFGDRPVIVLEAVDRIALGEWPDLPRPYKGEWWDLWVAGQQRYADESTRGELRPIPDVGYYIHENEPSAVATAIQDVINQIGD